MQGKTKTVRFWKGQFSGHFFFNLNFHKNVKCYGEKVLKSFLTLKIKIFSGHFFGKKNLENFLGAKKFAKLKKIFFFKKSVLKKTFFLSVKNTFQNFFPITFYIFVKIMCYKKKCPLNCLFSKQIVLVLPWKRFWG